MSKNVQVYISQRDIEKHLMDQNELRGGLTIDARLQEDNVLLAVWCVDTSTNEEVKIKSNRLNVGPNGTQTAFMWCVFLGLLTFFTNQLFHSELIDKWLQ